MDDFIFLDSSPQELLDDLEACVENLLLAYGESMRDALWMAAEKAKEACKCLLPLVDEGKSSKQLIFNQIWN